MADRRYDDAFTSPANTLEDRVNRYYGPVLLLVIATICVSFGLLMIVTGESQGWLWLAIGLIVLVVGILFARSRYRRVPDGGYGSEPYPELQSQTGKKE